jgi:uncharacterized membrane protein YhfC
VRNTDLSQFVTADQLPLAQAQVNAYWSTPWYAALTEFVQQLFTLPVQICLAIIMMQTFVRKQWYWILIAFGFHALFETTRVVAQNLVGGYWVALSLAIFGIASVFLIFAFRKEDSKELLNQPSIG